MPDLILEYEILEAIAKYSKSLGKRAEEYGERLESKIIKKMEDIAGTSSGYLVSANDSIRDKINELKQKAETFYNFAEQILNLIEIAGQVDQEVADAITAQRDYTLEHHKSLRLEDWRAKLLELSVDIGNSIPLLALLSDIFDGIDLDFESLKDSIKHWYECDVKVIGTELGGNADKAFNKRKTLNLSEVLGGINVGKSILNELFGSSDLKNDKGNGNVDLKRIIKLVYTLFINGIQELEIVSEAAEKTTKTSITLGDVIEDNPDSYPYDLDATGFYLSQQYYLAWYYGTCAYDRFDENALSHSSYLVYKLDKLRKSGEDLSALTVDEIDKMCWENESFWFKVDTAAIAGYTLYSAYLYGKGGNSAKGGANTESSGNTKGQAVDGVIHEFKTPGKRHYYSRISSSSPTKEINTIIDPKIDVDLDVQIINSGGAVRNGNDYIVNSRVYGVTSNGELFPRSGAGVYQLDRGAYNGLKILKQYGNTELGILRMNQAKLTEEAISEAIKVYELITNN